MSSERKMLKGSLTYTGIVGVIAVLMSALLLGVAGLVGALLAQLVVVIFFATSIGVARLTRDAEPIVMMAVAMASYFIKLFIVAGFLILVTRLVPVENCNRTAFGASAIAATFAWLGGEITAYLKLKTHLPLPPK